MPDDTCRDYTKKYIYTIFDNVREDERDRKKERKRRKPSRQLKNTTNIRVDYSL